MSLSDGTFNPKAWEGVDVIDMDGSAYESIDPLEAFVGRGNSHNNTAPKPASDTIKNRTNNDAAQQQSKTDNKVTNVRDKLAQVSQYQRQTTKLQAGKSVTASSGGAKAVGDYNNAKAEAVGDARKAVSALREEFRQTAKATGATASQASMSAPAAAGGTISSIGKGTLIGMAADVVVPGSGLLMGGLGSYVTSQKNNAVDAPQSGGSVGAAIDKTLSQGPGFGMNQIEYGVEPSLTDQDVRLDEEGLQKIDAQLAEMQLDAEIGRTAYDRWAATNIIGLNEGIGKTSLSSLEDKNGQAAALSKDHHPALREQSFQTASKDHHPALREQSFQTAVISPKTMI